MIEVTYDTNVEMHTSDKKLPLTELSFCIENAAAYFLGRGVWRMRFTRHFSDKCFHVNVLPKVSAKAMTFGFPAPLSLMVKEGFFPKTIKTEEFFSISGQRKQVKEGWNRLVEYSDEGTIILGKDMNPNMSLGLLCYGISDFVTGFFYHGSKVIDAQLSLGVVQYKLDKGYDHDWLKTYFLGKQGTDYPVHQTVDSLSF